MMGMKGRIEREKVMRERVYGRYRRWDSGETSERIERKWVWCCSVVKREK